MPRPISIVILPDVPPIPEGYKRNWLWCRKCDEISYYDYVPYDTEMPSFHTTCGHDFFSDLEYLKDSEVEGGLPVSPPPVKKRSKKTA